MATPQNNSVLKAFDILGLFSRDRTEIAASLVAQECQMTPATAHRFLMTLVAAGAIHATRRGRYALGPRLAELGWIAEETNALGAAVKPIIERLSQQLNESVMVCRLSQNGPTCVAVARSKHPISVNINIGTVLPFEETAQGRLWLANASPSSGFRDVAKIEATRMEDIRRRGYDENLGDNEPDIAAVSVPVLDQSGDMRLSLSVFGLLSRFDREFRNRARAALIKTAADIAEIL